MSSAVQGFLFPSSLTVQPNSTLKGTFIHSFWNKISDDDLGCSKFIILRALFWILPRVSTGWLI